MSTNQGNQQSADKAKPVGIMKHLHAMFFPTAILAGVQLKLFTALASGGKSIAELATALGVREEKLSPLLHILVAADMLRVGDGSFSNTPEADAFLVEDRPGYLGGLIGFYAALSGMTQNTAESIRTGRPQAKFDFQSLAEEHLTAYFRKQIHSSQAGGEALADRVDFSGFHRLLDAGGGSGGAAMALCRKYPRLQATVADVPLVARLAGSFIAEAGMSDRIAVAAVDLCLEQPEGAYDAALLRAVLQTFSKEDALKILRNTGAALTSGGRLFIVGSILDSACLGPISALVYGLVFVNTYDNGGAYTEDEYRTLLVQAGFGEIVVELETLSDGMGLISATKV